MAQARRIKQKPKKKSAPSQSPLGVALRELPWGLLIVILGSIAVILMLLQGSQTDNAKIGQGLKSVLNDAARSTKDSNPNPTPPPSEATEAPDPITDFDYYNVLPDIEKVMPDDLPENAALAHRDDGSEYYLQVASFKNRDDAERLRAQLALQGIVATTQAREVEGKGLYYRVRLGPFENQRVAKNSRTRLQKLGHEPFIFKQATVQ